MPDALRKGLSFDAVHARAAGQWPDILPALGLDAASLKNKHGPCPACGGSDRFRFDDKDGRGSFYCNQCGPGDGFKLLELVHGWDAAEALARVAGFLGMDTAKPVSQTERDALKAKAETRHQEADQADAERQRKATERARQIWEAAEPARAEHPYLAAKQVQAHGLRQGEYRKRVKVGESWEDWTVADALLVPIVNAAGEMQALQAIFPAPLIPPGESEARNKEYLGPKAGGFHLLGTPGKRLFIAEGYATAASVHEATGDAVAVAFDAGNLGKVAHALGRAYPGARLILAADNDQWTEGNPGLSKAQTAAAAVGGLVVLPVFVNLSGQPTDFNDLASREGQDQVKAVIEEQIAAADKAAKRQTGKSSNVVPLVPAAKAAPARKPTAPGSSRFRNTDKGLFHVPPDGDDPVLIGPPLEIVCKTRDKDGSNWGTLVRFTNPDGDAVELDIPDEVAVAEGGVEARRMLAREGYKTGVNRQAHNKLAEYIAEAKTRERAVRVGRLGWHGDAFLMPRQVIGEPAERLLYQNARQCLNNPQSSGTLDEWKLHIARLCRGNPRLIFGVSMAFAAPLLELVGMKSGGFHFYGASKDGKSTISIMAASVYGPESFMQSWKNTGAKLERTAADYSDLLLALDEIGECDSHSIGDTVYMLGNGRGKGRATEAKIAEWRLLFLSNGEKTLAQHMAEAGKTIKAGMDARLLAMPSDAGKGYGVFDELHGFPGNHELCKLINTSLVPQYHGTAGPAFLAEVIARRQELPRKLVNGCRNFAEMELGETAGGQARHAAQYFGLVAGAGELATEWGLTGWEAGEAITAARVCFRAWLDARGGAGNMEDKAMQEQVRLFFQLHGGSRFTEWDRAGDSHAPATVNRAGWKREEAERGQVFYVLQDVFKTEVCKGLDPKAVRAWLRSIGALVVHMDKENPNGRDPHIKYPGAAKKSRGCVAITSRVYLEQDEESDTDGE
ncbi:MAG: DUF927 domain-containing protein [Gammaproteobacteria bacterium]|nr:DUF927 domain-containing protein [Gammaproteobacteria bacterium]